MNLGNEGFEILEYSEFGVEDIFDMKLQADGKI